MARFQDQRWDAVVIGSGLGGLTAASLLVRAGKRVLILERHAVAGGFTHTFTRKGFEWDVGVHYVGQVHDPASLMRRLCDYVSDGALEWESMGATYDRAVIAGQIYDFVAGKQNQIAKLIVYFPKEEAAIREYFRLVLSAGQRSAWFFGEKTMPPWLSFTVGRLMRRGFAAAARRTTSDVLRTLTSNQRLIDVLTAQCGDYGLSPDRSSFGMHAILVEHYLEGGSYPRGGARRIHQTIVAGIEKRGGRIALKTGVEEILLKGGKVRGVRLADGEEVLAPVVISNAGVINTFHGLLPSDAIPAYDDDSRMDRLSASTAHVCLYVGLDGSDEELGLPKYNLWIHDNDAGDGGGRRLTYISFPSAKDPEWAAKHPNKATVQVVQACDYVTTKAWEGTAWRRRGEAYEAMKGAISEKLLDALYRMQPQLRGRVQYSELSTPLSTRHFMNNRTGEIYGLEHSPERFGLRWLRPRTSIPGLFLTGQDIVTVGVGGALFSGLLTAVAVLKARVLWQFLMRR